MKNYFPGILSFMLFSLGAQAQQMIPSEGGTIPDSPEKHQKFNQPVQRTNIVSDWYNYGQAVYDIYTGVSYFRNFLFPDSTVQVEFSDGMGYVWKHSIGEVFDPSSGVFDLNGQYSVDNTIPYTLDSIAIPYRYWRYQTAAADTVVVQVYMEPGIRLEPDPGWSSGASYANVEYDYTKRIGQGETLSFKHVLTSADTSTLTQGILEFATNLSIPAGQKVAATVTYLPGNPYSVNDTIDTYTTFPVTNRINAFVMYDFRDNDMMYEPLLYNNEVTVPTDVRYNINTNGWNGEYIPGTAWLSGIYYGDIYFRITFDTDFVGIDEHAEAAGIKIYPNPTRDILHVVSKTTILQATVKDLGGKTVLSENSNHVTAVDLSALGSGVYVISLTSESGQVYHQRFVKQ